MSDSPQQVSKSITDVLDEINRKLERLEISQGNLTSEVKESKAELKG